MTRKIVSVAPCRIGRCIALRIAALFLGFLPFVCIEIFLRAISSPSASRRDPFLDLDDLQPLFRLESDDCYRIPHERLTLFAPAEFPAKKVTGTKRLFFLGGSTTQGEPWGPATAFSAWVKINLELADPQSRFEAINCGGLSYASYRVLPILEEVLNYQPDAIVIYTGQNEFLEKRELSGWRRMPGWSVRWLSRLAQLQIIQQSINYLGSKSPLDSNLTTKLNQEVDALLDYQGGLAKYHRESLDRESTTESFRWNLKRMIELCKSHRVPLILITPVTNVKDCPPFKIELPRDWTAQQKENWNLHWEQAQACREHPAKALSILEKLLQWDPEHCGAHYYAGQLHMARGDWGSAKRHLQAAKDYDVCPLRATTAMRDTVRELSHRYQVWNVDADDLFQKRCPEGIVGTPWLVDHVHPSIEGNQQLGEAITDEFIRRNWIEAKDHWSDGRHACYQHYLSTIGEHYFHRGKQRLEGLLLWTQGRAKKVFKEIHESH